MCVQVPADSDVSVHEVVVTTPLQDALTASEFPFLSYRVIPNPATAASSARVIADHYPVTDPEFATAVGVAPTGIVVAGADA